MEIRKIKVCEVWNSSNWDKLLEEYTKEVKRSDFPEIAINKDLYQQLEDLETLTSFGAFVNDTLIGFILVVRYPSTHYAMTMFTTEGFMVLWDHRKTGAGLLLLHTVEAFVQESKGGALMISSPIGSRLDRVMERTDYKEAARVFLKRFVYE